MVTRFFLSMFMALALGITANAYGQSLAKFHADKAGCEICHNAQSGPQTKQLEYENFQCIECHGSTQEMSQLNTDNLAHVDTKYPCTACHQAHKS